MNRVALIRVSVGTLWALLSCGTSFAAAGGSCPWLTQGSAANALGGLVTVTVQVSDSGEGTCAFTRQQGTNDSLKISVQRVAQDSCPDGSVKLKGIGNEAVLCRVQRSPNELVEMVVSRVRELHFTVSFSLRGESRTGDVSRAEEAVKQIAEQVAGNLF